MYISKGHRHGNPDGIPHKLNIVFPSEIVFFFQNDYFFLSILSEFTVKSQQQ